MKINCNNHLETKDILGTYIISLLPECFIQFDNHIIKIHRTDLKIKQISSFLPNLKNNVEKLSFENKALEISHINLDDINKLNYELNLNNQYIRELRENDQESSFDFKTFFIYVIILIIIIYVMFPRLKLLYTKMTSRNQSQSDQEIQMREVPFRIT